MALRVNESFEEFNRDFVNLLNSRTQKARSSRSWLIQQLDSLDTKEDLFFPFKYQNKHINYGSFQRKTKIKELDDVDMMLCLTADGATYTRHSPSHYSIYTVNAGERLKKLSDDNVLNSRRVVNKFVDSLSNISQYQSAELNRRGEAAVLNLQSYEWVFDIVPCFYTDLDFYLIPDGQGNWKPTDPRIDQERTKNANPSNNAKALQLIRTLKYWNRRNSTYTIPSYLFENLVLNFIERKASSLSYIDFDIRDFFLYLSSAILSSVNDPKGFQEDLNSFNLDEKYAISRKADEAFEKAKIAVHEETSNFNQKKAINKWKEIFGEAFPSYT